MLSHQTKVAQLFSSDKAIRSIVSVLIIAAGMAYFFEATIALLCVSVLSPLTLLFAVTRSRTHLNLKSQLDLSDSHTLIQVLNDALKDDAQITPAACIVFRVDDLQDIKAEMGSQALSTIRGHITEHLLSLLRRGDHVAYVGDNQFSVALTHLRSPELGGTLALIKRIQKGCETPVLIDSRNLHISLSAGFCLSQDARITTGEKMLEAAKHALADASRHSPGGIRAFSDKTPQIVSQCGPSNDEINTAIVAGQITAWFQPQVSADTGKVTGMEALARWAHPTRGIIPSSEFIPSFVASHHMEALSENMLHHSLKAARNWDKAGIDVPSVSVNFSTQELQNPSLIERIKWDVDRFDLAPNRLTVEILETAVSNTADEIISRNIRALHSSGFNIDLDDFGTGHASIANIRRFAVDRVKIDRSFITHADDDPEQQRVISAIIGMAEHLGVGTIAKGIETLSERGMLSQLGCSHLQGFAIARPMPFEDTIEWLKQQSATIPPLPRFDRNAG
ncbi:MAG: GGDEF domain-containing phosphodiesterase [Litoreibacter sp.]